jgi:hypothetical protein
MAVTQELLVEFFRLDGAVAPRFTGMPADAAITGATYDPATGHVVFWVESGEFPDVPEGAEPAEPLVLDAVGVRQSARVLSSTN